MFSRFSLPHIVLSLIGLAVIFVIVYTTWLDNIM